MLFIEINGEKYPMKGQATTTQSGKKAIKIISKEAPLAMDGFKIVNEKGDVITDKSDFKYLYQETEDYKIYTTENENIIPTKSYYNGNQSESPYVTLSRQISAVSSQVSAITPYEESKTAYIEDKEVCFDIVREGNISIYMVDREGKNVPFTFKQINGQVVVSFEERKSLATVTMTIQ